MKRFITCLFAIAISLATSLNASAYDFEVNGISYNIISLTDLTCEVKSVNYNSGLNEFIEIPENVVYNNRSIQVIAIGDSAFHCDTRLREIKLPESIKRIGKSAFYKCSNLENVSMPNHIDSIHNSTFYWCEKLTNIKLPDSLKYIGELSFYFTKLTTLELPKSVKKIDNTAFGSNYALTDIKLSDSLEYIGKDVFYRCRRLNHIYIPKNVNTIQQRAFCECFATIEIDKDNKVYDSRNNSNAIILTNTNTLIYGTNKTIIPNTVTEIGDYAFEYNSFDKLILPNSITKIGTEAFYHCTINYLVIPNTVDELNLCFTGAKINKFEISDGDTILKLGIGKNGYYYKGSYRYPEGLFYACELSDVYIGRNLYYVVPVPNPAQYIELPSFAHNKTISSVTIGNKATIIGGSLFYDTPVETLTIYDGCQIIDGGAFASTNITSVEIPSSIKEIYHNAFYNTPLREITFHDGNDSLNIADNIFENCEKLTIGRNLYTDVETGAFPNVKELNFTSKAKFIQPNIFKNSTYLEFIDFGANIKHIGDNAFTGCDNIKQIITRNITPPENAIFSNKIYMNTEVKVPKGTLQTYLADINWRNFWNISEAEFSDIESIVDNMTETVVDVYTTQGTLVRKSVLLDQATQGLPQGIYIINGQKILVK